MVNEAYEQGVMAAIQEAVNEIGEDAMEKLAEGEAEESLLRKGWRAAKSGAGHAWRSTKAGVGHHWAGAKKHPFVSGGMAAGLAGGGYAAGRKNKR